PETRNPKPETRNPEPGGLFAPHARKAAGPKLENIPKPETRNQKPETRNQKPETRNPKPE
ncbi:hypothetical protein T484DRAFT_1586431, partial [Baffinella frigidus]